MVFATLCLKWEKGGKWERREGEGEGQGEGEERGEEEGKSEDLAAVTADRHAVQTLLHVQAWNIGGRDVRLAGADVAGNPVSCATGAPRRSRALWGRG